MTGPLAQQIAQVREALLDLAAGYPHADEAEVTEDCPGCNVNAPLAALSSIERHLHDMETALRQALDCKGPYNGTVSERGGDPALCVKCEAAARAALSAAPTATHQETK